MPFRVRAEEGLAEGLLRLSAEQMDRAAASLQEARGADAAALVEAVHDARKRFKKIRGALRLMRPGLGDVYACENARFRDAGRALAGARDAASMVEAGEALAAWPQGAMEEDLRRELLDWLRRRRDERVGYAPLGERIEAALEEIATARARLIEWPAPRRIGPLARGAEKTYARGRRGWRRCREAEDPESFHEWRKRTKYHWHHMRILRRLWPEAMKARAEEAKALADILGDAHDQAELERLLEGEGADALGERAASVAALARARGMALQARAVERGAPLYAEKPKALRKRLKALWRAA